MPRMAARPLVTALALAALLLHGSSVMPAVAGPEANLSLDAALAALPEPISAGVFFELVNDAAGPGYTVSSAQGGTQFMVITLSIDVPGDPGAIQQAASLPSGISNVDSFFDIYSDVSDVSGAGTGAATDAGFPSELGSVADLLPPVDYSVLVDGWASDTWIGGYQLDIDPSVTATTGSGNSATEPGDVGVIDTDTAVVTGAGAGVPGSPGNLSPGDRVLIDLDGDLQTRGDQTITIVGIISGEPEGPSTVASNPLPSVYDSLCPLDTDDGACFAAGNIAQTATRLFGECLGDGTGICPLLLGTGDYTLSVNLFPDTDSAPGGYTLHLNLDPDVISGCQADPSLSGCRAAALLQNTFDEYLSGCDANPTGGCGGLATTGGGGGPTGSGASTASTTSGEPIILDPDENMGFFELRETEPGAYRITDQMVYDFSPTIVHYLEAIFDKLPPGSTLATDDYRIRLAPDGRTFLLRDGDGNIFTHGGPSGDALVPLQANTDDPYFTELTGPGGISIIIPSPFATYVDVGNDPSGVATTPDEIATAAEGGGTGLIGVITSKGGSTGAVFDIRLLNMGKPARVEGDAIFEPLSATEADAVRNALGGLMGSVNSVFDSPSTGYCVEQDKAVPSAGELFRFANAAKSAEFSYAQKVLAGAREVEAAGLLHPDSDPGDYTHSTRQWAIWTAEKAFDKEGFTESFLEHTREVLAANGTQWSAQIEDAVRGLIDNRWNDVRQVLDAAGIPVAPSQGLTFRTTGPSRRKGIRPAASRPRTGARTP